MNIWQEALDIEDYVIACQRHLHENPELSDKEEETVAYILQQLRSYGIECEDVPQGGVMGYIGKENPGKTVLLRADIDALPMQEDTMNLKQPKVCVSKRPGAAHTCGHDTHTAILLGAAAILKKHENSLPGKVVLYFERGEEQGHGDYYMMKHIQDNNIHVDGAWGLHIGTGTPAGTVGIRSGGIYAGQTWFAASILGERALACGTAVVNSLNTLRMRRVNPFEQFTLAVNKFQFRDGVCRIAGTCRFYDADKIGRPMREAILQVINETIAAYGCTTEKPVTRNAVSRGVINSPVCCDIAKQAIGAAIGQDKVLEGDRTMGAESFAVLSTYYPSVFIRLNAGNPEKGMTAGGHSPQYETDSAAYKTGVAATVAYAFGFLENEKPIPFEPFVGDMDEYLASGRR